MAPSKRSASPAGRSAKRGRADTRIPTVVHALSKSDSVPPNLCELLRHALPIALKNNKVDRHAYEAEVIEQAEKALQAVEDAIQKQHADSTSKQNDVISDSELSRRTSSKQEAEAKLEAAKSKVDDDKAAKKTAEKTLEDAESTLRTAKQEEKSAEKSLQQQTTKQETLSSSLSIEFAMLRDGTSVSAAGKKAVQKLQSLGKEYGLDGTLLHTLPITCKKLPTARSEFENSVFSSLQVLLEAQIQIQAQKVAEAEPIKAAKAAAAAAAQEAVEQAKTALKTASHELDAANTARQEASKEVTKADHFLRRIWEDMREACDAQDQLAAELSSFKDNVWKAFHDLKEKEPEPEQPEEPEAATEAIAEAASETGAQAEAPAETQA